MLYLILTHVENHAILEVAEDEDMFIVTSFKSSQKGCGTILLQALFHKAYQYGKKYIILDDCSDRFGKPDNIYIKNGFVYVNQGEPEMYKEITKPILKFPSEVSCRLYAPTGVSSGINVSNTSSVF